MKGAGLTRFGEDEFMMAPPDGNTSSDSLGNVSQQSGNSSNG